MTADFASDIKLRLREFKQKFYLNQVIRGSLLLSVLFAALFTTFVLTEGVFWFSQNTRTILFFALIASTLGYAYLSVFHPLMAYLNLGKTISDDEAALIIGQHFPEIEDKLLNLLQLENSNVSSELLAATISERTKNLKPFVFHSVINLNVNYKYARYLTIPLLILLFAFFISPDTVTKGAYRLVNFNQKFTPPPPYQIEISNHKAQVTDGESFGIKIQVKGKTLPKELFLYYKEKGQTDFQPILLNKENISNFSHQFKNVHSDFEYYIGNEVVANDPHSVSVLKRPNISNFKIVLQYPAYTQLAPETLASGIGDLSVIKGTVAQWNFDFQGELSSASFSSLADEKIELNGNQATFRKQLLADQTYKVNLLSKHNIQNVDTVRYAVTIQADKFPTIQLNSPASEFILPANGFIPLQFDAGDDFGISRAVLTYSYLKSENPDKQKLKNQMIPLGIGLNKGSVSFNKAIDFIGLGMSTGDEIEYSITVWDNDGVNGPKATVSQIQRLKVPSLNAIYNDLEDQEKKLEKEMDETLKKADEQQKDYKKIVQKFTEKKNLDYEDKKQISDYLKTQQTMMEKASSMRQKMNEMRKFSQNNQLFTEETQKKMEQIEKLMEDIEKSDMKKELEKLLEQYQNKENRDLKKQMENLKYDQEKFQNDLERTKELLNQIKADQKAEEMIKKLENIKEQQNLLEDKAKQANKEELKDLEQKQDKLNHDAKDLKKDLDELKEIKKQTSNPQEEEMKDIEKTFEDMQKDMQDSQNQLSKMNKSGASKSQKSSSQKMEKMQQQLSDMQMEAEEDQDAENLEDLRNLLENLLKLSFKQEELRDEVKQLRYNDPKVKVKAQEQRKLRDDMEMVKDSLYSLSKRVFQISKFVTDELQTINKHMDFSLKSLDDLQLANAQNSQHFVMTSLNNLANMLSESQEQMMQQMKQQQQQKNKGGGGACKKPGGNNPSMQGMAKKQGQLNQMLQQMMREKGQSGKGGEGSKEGQGGDKLDEFAKQQEEIRKGLKELFDKLEKEGQGGMGSGKKILEDMEKTEKDLQNELLTQEMLHRQQQILNRMLDYDKAVREQEMDPNRESKSGQELNKVSPNELSKSDLNRVIRKEQFNVNKRQFTREYQLLIDEYLKQIQQ